MRLFRSIQDSGFVPVFPLTALVGREHSGKTTLLRALRGVDLGRSEPYALDRDWPRGSRQPRTDGHVVCAATYRLGTSAYDDLVQQGVIEPEVRGVVVGRCYDGSTRFQSWSGTRPAEPAQLMAAPSELEEFARANLPSVLYVGHESLVHSSFTSAELLVPRHGAEGTATAALARLLAEVEWGASDVGLEERAAKGAGRRVRELMERRNRKQPLLLESDRGRVLLRLQVGGARPLVDELPGELRFRLTVDLLLAAADGARALLLLDGPGRSFRRHALGRMRSLFEEYVESGATVLYSARLPFDIELQHSEQVLVLSPARPGSMVDGHVRGANEQLALRAALGMTGRTSFRVDDVNLIVEGPSDAHLLRALDDLLVRSGEQGLPPGVHLTSAQGAHEVTAVSAFLARRGLGVIALFDSDSAGRAGREALRREIEADERLGRVELLLLGEAAGLEGRDAAIEDLFPLEYFLDVVRRVHGASVGELLTSASVEPETEELGPIASRLSRRFSSHGQRFAKGRVAEELVSRVEAMESADELPPGMLGSVRGLMRRLGDCAGRVQVDVSTGESAEEEARSGDS